VRHISPKKKRQFLLLILYQLIVGYISLKLNFNAPYYLLVSWGLPSLFFLYKIHINRHQYILEALLWSIPGSVLIDWIGHYSKAWSYWDNPLFASTGISILGIPFESFLWGSLFWIFYVLVYEYFFDENRASNFNSKEKFLALGFMIIGLVTVIVIRLLQPDIPFFYIYILLLLMFLTAICLAQYRELVPRVLKFGFVVLILGLQVEYFSLKLSLWFFPDGDFLQRIIFFGHSVPIEELLAWLIAPAAIAAIHEVFADNHQ